MPGARSTTRAIVDGTGVGGVVAAIKPAVGWVEVERSAPRGNGTGCRGTKAMVPFRKRALW